jgi:AMP phosphorylase
MKLKVKFLKWSAGLPVAMLNIKTAKKIGVHGKDRIFIKKIGKPHKQISTIIDTVEGLITHNEIAVSSELKNLLNLKLGQSVDVGLAMTSKSLLYIRKKMDKKKLSEEEIREIIRDIVSNSLSEPEIAMFISAMYQQGMSFKEVVFLINAILETGNRLVLRNKYIADKHCIGGIAGNRTTPIVVSICSAGGIIMPKTSSRAITSAAGTADVIETISKVEFSVKRLKKIIQKTKACLAWGGSLGVVPADSKIIKIERVLKIDPRAQLLASIMSKKIALGSNYILIDIPFGKKAKVDKTMALKLKKEFERLGKYFKKDLRVVLTKGDEPIGNGIGPALELNDVIKVLSLNDSPKDLEKKSLFLAGRIFEMTKISKKGEGYEKAKKILYSRRAFKKFKEIIRSQGGKVKILEPAKFRRDILSGKSGKVFDIDNKKINLLARIAGCPVNKFAGIYLYCHVGNKVKKDGKLMTLYCESKSRLEEAFKFYQKVRPIKIR